MNNTTSTHDKIREALSVIGNDATNKQIKEYCQEHFGMTPISQTIYSCIGSEWGRQAERLSAKELSDSKKFVRSKFEGDTSKAIFAISMIDRVAK